MEKIQGHGCSVYLLNQKGDVMLMPEGQEMLREDIRQILCCIRNHGSVIITGGIAEGPFLVKQSRQKFNIQHILADAAVCRAFGRTHPADVALCYIR